MEPEWWESGKGDIFKKKGTYEIKNKVKATFETYIAQLEQEDRIGNAEAYRNAKASILKYGGEAMQFVEVNPVLLLFWIGCS